jgi:Family of unknown function (DUF6444)
VERAEAEAIYEQGRDAVVELLALSAQNERLVAEVGALTARVARREERIAQLERKTGRSSRNSSQPPSQDPPGSPPRRGKDPSGRRQGAQPGREGKGATAAAGVGDRRGRRSLAGRVWLRTRLQRGRAGRRPASRRAIRSRSCP